MVIMSPGGFEGYFDELAGLVEKHGFPSPPTSWLNSWTDTIWWCQV